MIGGKCTPVLAGALATVAIALPAEAGNENPSRSAVAGKHASCTVQSSFVPPPRPEGA